MMKLPKARTLFVIICLLPLLALAVTAQPAKAASGMPTSKKTIFRLIDEIGAAEPIDLERLRAATGSAFYVIREIGPRIDYEAKNISLKDVAISSIDFRSGPNLAFVVLKLSGCITRKHVAGRFHLGQPMINATDAQDTGVYFEAPWRYGRISFEFLYARPDCLSSVVIESR